MTDHLGSVRMVVDVATGALVETYRYDELAFAFLEKVVAQANEASAGFTEKVEKVVAQANEASAGFTEKDRTEGGLLPTAHSHALEKIGPTHLGKDRT